MANLPETPLDLLAALKRVAEDHPFNTNPRPESMSGVCAYSDEDGRHCYLGQTFIDVFGMEYDPDWEWNGAADILALAHGDLESLDEQWEFHADVRFGARQGLYKLAEYAQKVADDRAGMHDIAWSEVYARLEARLRRLADA